MQNQTRLKVLLVDDKAKDVLRFRKILSQCRAFVCDLDCAASLQDAQTLIERACYDAYFFDLRLLQQNLQIAQQVRESNCRAPIVVLDNDEHLDNDYLDDDNSLDLDSAAQNVGADDFLVKNHFDAALLQRVLRTSIERRHFIEELQSAQTRSSLLISAANCAAAGIVVSDPQQPDNPIIYANPGFCQLTGYTRDEIVGRNCRFLAGPQTDAAARTQMRHDIDASRHYSGTLLNYRKDGTTFWNDLRVNPVFDSSGKLVHFVGVQTDVTQRVEAQAMRNRMAAIVESSPDAIYSRDFNGIVTSWNSGAAALFEYSNEEMIGQSVFQIVDAAYMDDLQSAQILIKSGHTLRDIESEGIRKSGARLHLSLSLAPIRDDSGEVIEIAVVARDVSERKRHEQQLHESNKRITDIWESINDGFFSLDSAGRFTYMNARAAAMLRSDARDVLGQNIWDVFPEAVTTQFYRQYQAVLATNQSVHFEEYHQPLGRWLEIHAYPTNEETAVYFRDVSERKAIQSAVENLNSKLQQRVQRLSALHQIDLAISGSFDLKITLGVLLSHLMQQLRVDAARVWLRPDSTEALESAVQMGFNADEKTSQWRHLGEGLAGQVAQHRQAVSATSSTRTSHAGTPHIPTSHLQTSSTRWNESEDVGALFDANDLPRGFHFYRGVPLLAKGRLLGVLEVLTREPFSPDDDWIEFLDVLASEATIAIDNSLLFSQLQRSNSELFLAYDTTIEGWSRALDLRDKETEGHSSRVTELTIELAQAADISDEELAHVRRGALLHDIGKMGIPDGILLKPGALTPEEWNVMKQHPLYAYQLLSPIDFLRRALDIPYCHHEKWDGSGYPRGLHGEQIPLSARLFAVVDVWDALTSDRPYRAAWTKERARAHIAEQSGTHFDPQVVEIFLQHIQ